MVSNQADEVIQNNLFIHQFNIKHELTFIVDKY